MIQRLRFLQSIGQFDSVNNAANIPLARLTLIYSENGRGKTTIAAILRSLATGDPMPIAERKRLTAQRPPHAVLDCVGGPPPAVFENNAWNRTLPEISVFDDIFINENVHSGLMVQVHHRQNLHELILGRQAVVLSGRLQALVAQIESHNSTLRNRERAIPTMDRGSFSVDEFCSLPNRPDIDQAIQESERALAAARDQEAVRTTPSFGSLDLPRFDLASVERVLAQDLPALDAATLTRVQAHLARLGQSGEPWVADGMHRIPQGEGDGACPFCAQDLNESPIIHHYRAYFSETYATLKSSVMNALRALNSEHGGDVPAGFERAVRIVIERRQFWARFCEVPEISIDTAAILGDWKTAREAISSQLATKQSAPLEPMLLADEIRAIVATFEVHRGAIATINQQFQVANRAIEIAKERAVTANSAVLASDLARLKATKARHVPVTAVLCDNYLREREAKERTEQERDQTRTALEQHRARVFPGYQTAINLYLQRFNAGFRLDSVTHANTRGGPACTYNVLINNTPIPVGGAEPSPGEPSFRNTLSAGDRNALALSFFFASLDQDAGLANKVVVIDDPISSLDEHRSLTTVQEIRRLAERCAQVIVLSHSKPFQCHLWEGTDDRMRAALEVVRDGGGSSTLQVWDVAQDAITEHDRRHERLREYLDNGAGEMREVAQSIRPHLEAFLRVAFPGHCPPGKLLGSFLNDCRQRHGTANVILDQASTQELEEIVEYANRFHHDTIPAVTNDGELRGFVDRALRFTRR